jgi:hypothetical protein
MTDIPHRTLKTRHLSAKIVARVTGLEPATSGVTGRHSNQLSYTRVRCGGADMAMPL